MTDLFPYVGFEETVSRRGIKATVHVTAVLQSTMPTGYSPKGKYQLVTSYQEAPDQEIERSSEQRKAGRALTSSLQKRLEKQMRRAWWSEVVSLAGDRVLTGRNGLTLWEYGGPPPRLRNGECKVRSSSGSPALLLIQDHFPLHQERARFPCCQPDADSKCWKEQRGRDLMDRGLLHEHETAHSHINRSLIHHVLVLPGCCFHWLASEAALRIKREVLCGDSCPSGRHWRFTRYRQINHGQQDDAQKECAGQRCA